MSTLNSGMWERLHKGLVKLAEEKHHDNIAEVKLFISTIISAGKERDIKYLTGNDFLYHCHLTGMNSIYIYRMIERAWYFIDNNIPILPETEEANDNESDDNF